MCVCEQYFSLCISTSSLLSVGSVPHQSWLWVHDSHIKGSQCCSSSSFCDFTNKHKTLFSTCFVLNISVLEMAFFLLAICASLKVSNQPLQYENISTGFPKIKSTLGYLTIVSTSDSQKHFMGPNRF